MSTKNASLLPALLAAATLAGCGGSGIPDVMNTLDIAWVFAPDEVEDTLADASSDGLLTNTSDWIEGAGDAVAGHTLTLPFDEDGTALDEDALADELDGLVGALVDAMKEMATSGDTASPLLQRRLPDDEDWDDLRDDLTEDAAAGMAAAIDLDTLQPGDYLVEWDDCSKIRIDALDSLSVEIVGVAATADSTGIDIAVELGSPVVALDEVRLWHRRWSGECVPRTVEGATLSLEGLEFEALTLHVDTARVSASYDWPRLEISASSWCGEEIVYSSTYHDIIYGSGGAGLPSHYAFSYLDIGYTVTAGSEIEAAFDGLSFGEKLALVWDALDDFDSLWDHIEAVSFLVGVIDDVIRIAIDETLDSAIDSVGDWLADQFGAGASRVTPYGNLTFDCQPDGDPLHGDHVAFELAMDVDPTDASSFGMTLVSYTLDTDNDDVLDPVDNCPGDANPSQGDADFDGIGDACDGATLPPGLVSLLLDGWEAEAEYWASIRAIVVCGAVRADHGEMFDMAGFRRPEELHILSEVQALDCLAELEELLRRIKDRHDERWPGEEHVVLAPTVDTWLAENPLTAAQLQLLGAYIDAATAMAEADLGDGSTAVRQLSSVREQIAAHVQIQPGL